MNWLPSTIFAALLALVLGIGCGKREAGNPLPEDISALTELAEKGDAEAQTYLGLSYANGFGVEQDYKEAFKWHRKAAEQNNPQAQCHLGYMYASGQGVDKNEREAMKWLRKAAEQNYSPAQYYLAVMYRVGERGEGNHSIGP